LCQGDTLSHAEEKTTDRSHRSERSEVGVIANRGGGDNKAGAIGDGTGRNPDSTVPERTFGRKPLRGSDTGACNQAADQRGKGSVDMTAYAPADVSRDWNG